MTIPHTQTWGVGIVGAWSEYPVLTVLLGRQLASGPAFAGNLCGAFLLANDCRRNGFFCAAVMTTVRIFQGYSIVTRMDVSLVKTALEKALACHCANCTLTVAASAAVNIKG